jgi:DNA helicase-2/ATP-dependent DNA helicase PcrA
MAITLSQEQQAVKDRYLTDWCDIAVQAAAGSGKTEMIKQMVQDSPAYWGQRDTAYFVFNSSAKESAQERITSPVHISTFHSLGLSLINTHLRGKSKGLHRFHPLGKMARISEKAVSGYIHGKLTKQQYGFISNDDPRYWPVVYRTAALAELGMIYNVKTYSQLHDVATKHKVDQEDDVVNNALRVIKDRARDIKTVNRFNIGFADMMYHAANISPDAIHDHEKFEIIFVDEAQDASAVRNQLVELVKKPHGRVIRVGDINQAIYGFAGSDSDNFRGILDDPDTVVMPLTTCFRSSQAVIRQAQQLDPTIQARPDAPEGFVGEVEDITNITVDDAILCRNNAPLFSYYFKLLRMGIDAVLMTEDDVPSMMLDVVRKAKVKTVPALLEHLTNLQAANAAQPVKVKKGIDMADVYECVELAAAKVQERLSTGGRGGRRITKPADFVDLFAGVLNEMFTPKGDAVTLCSIHKSKGLEWDSVYWIRPDLMPSSMATMAWELLEESNLLYVLFTRAKTNFYKVLVQ